MEPAHDGGDIGGRLRAGQQCHQSSSDDAGTPGHFCEARDRHEAFCLTSTPVLHADDETPRQPGLLFKGGRVYLKAPVVRKLGLPQQLRTEVRKMEDGDDAIHRGR
jgi:hypothetical protein